MNLSREIFSQGAPLRWVFPLLGTSVPEILGMVLPMAAVLGGLMGTQTLSHTSELVAAQGLGAGIKTFLKPWFALGLGLVVLASLNAHWVVPAMSRVQTALKQKMTEEAKSNFLKPGTPPRPLPSSPKTSIWVSPEGAVHVMEVSPQGVQHLTAQGFSWALETLQGDPSAIRLELKGLRGCILVPGQRDSVVHLNQDSQEMRFPLPPSTHFLEPTPLRFLPTRALFSLPTPAARVELARRFSLPVSAAALLLIGIALGFGHPRFQRGGAILKSLGVILGYYLVLKLLENKLLGGSNSAFLGLLLLPLGFLGLGGAWLALRVRPHHSNPLATRVVLRLKYFYTSIKIKILIRLKTRFEIHAHPAAGRELRWVLARWSRRLWVRNWAATFGSLLLLNLVMEYANLAGDLAKGSGRLGLFFLYWAWNLPPFLSVALPVSFLLGTVMALSQATLLQEWNALKAGGISLWQWIWSARRAWGGVLLATWMVQLWVAPIANKNSDILYRKIINRKPPSAAGNPWMNLGNTGVLWYLDREDRWGFPLKGPGEAPVLLHWRAGQRNTEALPWGGLQMVPGPSADRLFPDRALRESAFATETPTLDLVRWQRWAPDPERAAILWDRFLGWLAGPCLALALLSFAFPPPRAGRGQALGFALVGGLLYLGLQAIFFGAARAGEVPAAWGILAPLFLLVGFGVARLPRLRT